MLIGRSAAVLVVLLMPAVAAAQTTPPPDAERPAETSTVQPDLLRTRTTTLPELFTSLGRDLTAVATRNNLWIAGVGASGAFASHSLDGRIAGSGWGRGFGRVALHPGKVVGGALAQGSAALGTYAIGRATGNARLTRLGAELTRAQVLAQSLTHAIKFSAQRVRPDGTSLSFPSGHTSATFATATVLHREFGWKAGVPAYTIAAWVAASRMQQERHYLSDVIAGATLGIIAGRAVTVGRGETRFAMSPMFVPGGAGVSFDLLK